MSALDSPRRALERVGIVGGGIIGTGIAEVCARAGLDVTLVELDEAAAGAAAFRVGESMDRPVRRGKLEAEAAAEATERLRCVDDFDALADREIVVEAVVEDRDAKLAVFERLARTVVDERAILASNTSSIPIVELAAATGQRAERVIGLHFFNPVSVLSLVEVIPSLLTDDAVAGRARAFAAEQLGKDPIVAPDRAGFTVNALLIPYLLSAIRMVRAGAGDGGGHRPGHDQGLRASDGPARAGGHDRPRHGPAGRRDAVRQAPGAAVAPPPLLRRLVAANLLGCKTARGLYRYG